MLGAGRAGMAFLSVISALGCADLGDVSYGRCGNGFVEPSAGEDCDGPPGAGLACRAPGETGECRFDCSSNPEACPAEMRCGQDGICRAATGSFDPDGKPLDIGDVYALATGDVDGDGRSDLVAFESRNVSFHYFDQALEPVESRSMASLNFLSSTLPAVGEVSGDSRIDTLIPTGFGFVVQLGAEDRARHAIAYPTLTLPNQASSVRMLAIDVLPDKPGDEFVIFGTVSGNTGLVYVDVNQALTVGQQLLTTLPAPMDQGIDPILVGKLDEKPACEQLVVGYEDKSTLYAFTPCRVNSSGATELNLFGKTRPLELPPGRVATHSMALLDVNGDGHLDLVVGTRADQTYELSIGYGVGDGSLHSTAAVPASGGDNQLSVLHKLDSGPPLAIADINGDRAPDWVHAKGVRVSAAGKYVDAWNNTGPDWTLARIASFNLTGSLDVVAAEDTGTLWFLNGDGDKFTAFNLGSGGQVRTLGVGDFDGDLVADVAIAREKAATLDELSVSFGQAAGAPVAPADIGLLDPVQQIAVGRFGVNVLDAASDFGAVTLNPDGSTGISAVGGSSARDLRSPLGLSVLDAKAVSARVFAPFQHLFTELDGDGHADLAALAIDVGQLSAGIEPPEHRLFLVPLTGVASARQTSITSTDPLPQDVDWGSVGLSAIDLDSDGISELILLGRSADGSSGRWGVVKTEPADKGFRFAAPIELSSTDFVFQNDASLQDARGLSTIDLDADGDLDLVAIATAQAGASLVVFWNANGTLEPPVALPALSGGSPIAFAAVRFGRRSRLAVLSNMGVYSPVFDKNHAVIANQPMLPNAIGSRLAAADFDGDGVDDLIVAASEGARIYRGIPVHD